MCAKSKGNLFEFDLDYLRGRSRIVGIDEAGRGALAGPVVAAAIMLTDKLYSNPDFISTFDKLNDSKQVDAKHREEFFHKLENLKKSGVIDFEAGVSTVEEIESINILAATKLAMMRALETLNDRNNLSLAMSSSPATLFGESGGSTSLAEVLVDGLPLKGFKYRHNAIVKGDASSFVIAAASIIAKVSRDKMMMELALQYPKYDFDVHKGYGTALHSQNLIIHGASEIHRKSFLKNLRADSIEEKQGELF